MMMVRFIDMIPPWQLYRSAAYCSVSSGLHGALARVELLPVLGYFIP